MRYFTYRFDLYVLFRAWKTKTKRKIKHVTSVWNSGRTTNKWKKPNKSDRIKTTMTITRVQWVCCGIVLLAVLCSGGRQYGTRKIRHDHKSQDEGTQPDIDFEFETTKGFQFENGGDYEDPSEEGITLDVVHSLYDTRKGVVLNIVYQGRYHINDYINKSTIYTLQIQYYQ